MIGFRIIHGDCLVALDDIEENSIDACVTDPPYHLTSIVKRFGSADAAPAKVGKTGAYARASAGFMGKLWDGGNVSFRPETWAAVYRVLKPGAHLIAFGGTRTFDMLVTAIRAANFEIRDTIVWITGQGFPKSHNVGNGWGSALKPAVELIVLARKPLIGTIAANVLAYGTGAINIDGCRVAGEPWAAHRATGLVSVKFFSDGETPVIDKEPHLLGRWPANLIHDGSEEVLAAFPESRSSDVPRNRSPRVDRTQWRNGGAKYNDTTEYGDSGSAARFFKRVNWEDDEWLAQNLDLSLADIAEMISHPRKLLAAFALKLAATSVLPGGTQLSVSTTLFTNVTANELRRICEASIEAIQCLGPKFLREWQREKLTLKTNPVNAVVTREPTGTMTITLDRWKSDGSADPVMFIITSTNLEVGAPASRLKYCAKATQADRNDGLAAKNKHPTVKPIKLMRYLTRLVTPPGGTILDPFCGSGSTGKAAMLEGFRFIGIESEAEYVEIAKARVAAAMGVFA